MTLTQTLKSIFITEPEAIVNDGAGRGRQFLSKISGAFMLPISVMAIAGLFLGVGNAIAANTSGSAAVFGQFLQNMGNPIFDAMPALFMVAIIVSFTDDIATAVFAGLVSFLVFNALQLPFIQTTDVSAGKTGSAQILYALNEDLGQKLYKVVGSNLGIKSLSTSVFGGIVVGFIVSWCYKRFHQVELPTAISFFGGKRFVPFVAILLMIPLSFLFLLVWPWVGIGLAYFGQYSGKIYGLDSFVFGVIERSLIPFGLHHVFYAPLWWTAAGGDPYTSLNDWLAAGNQLTGAAATVTSGTESNLAAAMNGVYGDTFTWVAVNKLPYNEVSWIDSAGGVHSQQLYPFFKDQLGLSLGRFMQGKYGFMQFALPAAGLAMVMAAPKENRRLAAGIVFPASLTSFVTGVTEPIEFTFVFLAPALFWGFHALMAGVSFLIMNIAGAHMGMTFSGGIIDTVLYGAIPIQKGTNFWWAYVIEAGYAPIYYFVFYWAIKRFDLATPGRNGATSLITKAAYKAAKTADEAASPTAPSASADERSLAIIAAFGGPTNIVKVDNCASRLRVDVRDAALVDTALMKAAGAMGVMKISKSHVQAIFGGKSDVYASAVKKALAAGVNIPDTGQKAKDQPVKAVQAVTDHKHDSAPSSTRRVATSKVGSTKKLTANRTKEVSKTRTAKIPDKKRK